MNKEKIIEFLKENVDVLKDLVAECNCYDGSLEDYYYFENDEYFFQDFFGHKVDDAVRAVCYGSYKYMDDYVRFDAYGNLESCSEFALEKELKENAEEIFDIWYELYQEKNVNTYDNNLKELLEEDEVNEEVAKYEDIIISG